MNVYTFSKTREKSRNIFARLGIFASLILPSSLYAEGTKQISPNTNNLSAFAVLPNQSRGPFLSTDDGIVAQRIRVRIADLNEKVYFGFQWQRYGNSTVTNNVWMRIYDPNGNEVTAARYRFQSTNSVGWISGNLTNGYNAAVAGPNGLGGVSNGYTPYIFTPTALGEYSIIVYESTQSAGNTMINQGTSSEEWFKAPYWDITVGNPTLPTAQQVIPGRLFSQNWSLVAIDNTFTPTAAATAAPVFYSYSHDQTLIKLGFGTNPSTGNGGLKPIAYNVGFTHYGINESLTWDNSRKSSNSTNNPSITDGYKVFLSPPSQVLYPIEEITESPKMGAIPISGCPGSSLTAHYYLPESGDVRILFDIDGNGDGYTPNTRDFVLEAFAQPAGVGSIVWNGRDGLGNYLASGTAVKLSATYQRGRFNLPIYDAEVNQWGLYIETIAPLFAPSNKLYWNDTALQNVGNVCNTNTAQNNITGSGWNNSFSGTVSSRSLPTRAWNGNGNPSNATPALAVSNNDQNGLQCDDYGNVRVLNTWGWALEAESEVIIFNFGCYNVSGNIFNDANGLANGLIDNSSSVSLPTGMYVHLISSKDSVVRAVMPLNANGTYNFNNTPAAEYKVVITNSKVSTGNYMNLNSNVSLPIGWENVGEQKGTIPNVGIDPIIDGIYSFSLNSNITDINFGIRKINTTNAVNDENSTWVNTPVSGDVTTNDFDIENNTQSFGSFLNPNTKAVITSGTSVAGTNTAGNPVSNAGSISFQSNGTYTFTPANNFVGNVSIPYYICDNGLPIVCDTAYLDITVSPKPKDANSIIANNDEYFVPYGTSLNGNILLNDADPQNDYFKISSYLIDNNGSGNYSQTGTLGTAQTIGGYRTDGVWINNAGTLTQNDNGTFNFEPTSNFEGTITYLYTICDTITANIACDNARVEIVVNKERNEDINSRPFAGDDFAYTKMNTPVNANFFENDNDPNSNAISIKDENGVAIVIDPSNSPVIVNTLTTIQGGTVVLYSDGNYTYNPPLNHIGTDQVVYEICDVTTLNPQPLCASATIHMLIGEGINISGNIWHDPNGDAIKAGTEKSISGIASNNNNGNSTTLNTNLYANLVDENDMIVATVQVSNDGQYSFSNVSIGGAYKVILSSGTSAPTINTELKESTLPNNWMSTGVNINSTANTTNHSGIIDLGIVREDKSNLNFGIQQKPTADPKSYHNIDNEAFGSGQPLNDLADFPKVNLYHYMAMSNPLLGKLTGSDPEDCPTAGSCNDGADFLIQQINSNTKLYYKSGNTVTEISAAKNNMLIKNFDANNLVIYIADGSGDVANPIGFTYSLVDNAGASSPAATYTITTIAPLPVKFGYFNAVAQKNNAHLSWNTLSEQNNKGFNIQRSIDAKQWETIEFVSSKAVNGNSQKNINYATIDYNTPSGKVYYRLAQIDFDGKIILSDVKTLQFAKNAIEIYPNPASTTINIKGIEAGTNLSIYDVSGRLVFQKQINENSIDLDIRSYAEGIYTLQFNTKSGDTEVFKIHKKH